MSDSGSSGMMTTVVPVVGTAGLAGVLALCLLFAWLALARRMRRAKPRPRAQGAIPVTRFDGGEVRPADPASRPSSQIRRTRRRSV